MIHDDANGRRAFALPGSTLHYGPDKTVDVEHIDLRLTPDLEQRRLDAVCTTTVRALDEPVSILSLDAVDLDVTSVERDGKALRFTPRGGRLDVSFEPPIAAEQQATFAITYSATKPRHGLFFVEPSAEYPDKVPHAWTQCQDQNARYWFPCLDYPDEKQTTSATITVPKGQFALSNGTLVERRDDGAKTIFRYKHDTPHSTYLVTMVAGPFVEVEQAGASVPVYYYVLPGREADGERSFGKTPQMVNVFEERLAAPYPYPRYSQIAVSDFIFGGMENTTATTQTDRTLHDERAHLDFSSDPLVAHELAHQWFGDLLTCRDWSQAWLNESFATFFEGVFREADLGYDEYVYDVFEWVKRYLEEDKERYRRPIVCNDYRDPVELFDRHLYEKGGAVLHMLRGELGEARFWRSMRRYVRDNNGRSVETIDLIRAIEQATGRNMRAFFDRWVFGAGHPQLKVGAEYDGTRRVLTVTMDQLQKVDAENRAFAFDVDIEVDGRRIRVHVEREHETVTIPLDSEPALVRFDPGAFILADVAYAFGVRLASASLADDPSVIARIRAGRELVKEGSAQARSAIAAAFERESFWGVLAELAEALGKSHAAWARDVLLGAMKHKHPKVRRAAAAALGEFKDEAAEALTGPAKDDESYFVRRAALHALGKTRDKRAFKILSDAAKGTSWNGVVESGAAAGLGELGDARATAVLIELTKPGKNDAIRAAALLALARQAQVLESERAAAVDTIARALDDESFAILRGAIDAAEHLDDKHFLPALDRSAENAFDGRLRRDAAEAALRIRESQKTPAQVTGLRTDLDALRAEHRRLQEKLETLSRA
ncbi:MAG TPA: M1 family metallopeptidase [Candidatus Rubrimentiphilum sp.]|nr:M1 family metallopeptidase [Candidatus Rubrimentiphilum sp.]